MKALLPLALFLAGCSSGAPKPLFVERGEPRAFSAAEQERSAQEAIADIERRIESGDLPKILFESGKDEITPESAPTLDLLAEVLRRDDKLKVMILAHTDSIGGREYNEELSERRANAVKAALAKRGVPPPSMRFKGFGFSRPIADNGTDAGRAKNRRVEFRVTARGWPAVY